MSFADGVPASVRRDLRRAYRHGEFAGAAGDEPGRLWWWERVVVGVRRLWSSITSGGR